MTSVVITQPMLFPWPGFFEHLSLADTLIYLDDAQFSKGSFTNRIQLRFPGGRKWMTIPLTNQGTFQPICDLSSPNDDWRTAHRDMLRQSLRGQPYIADALAIVDEAYSAKSVCDTLIASCECVVRYLNIEPANRARSSKLGVEGVSWQRVLDLVTKVGGTRYLTGHGAAEYLDHQAFEDAGVFVEYMDYSLTPWLQTTKPFTPYVTVLDLIAATGPRAKDYLAPKAVPWRTFLAGRAAGEPSER